MQTLSEKALRARPKEDERLDEASLLLLEEGVFQASLRHLMLPAEMQTLQHGMGAVECPSCHQLLTNRTVRWLGFSYSSHVFHMLVEHDFGLEAELALAVRDAAHACEAIPMRREEERGLNDAMIARVILLPPEPLEWGGEHGWSSDDF